MEYLADLMCLQMRAISGGEVEIPHFRDLIKVEPKRQSRAGMTGVDILNGIIDKALGKVVQ